MPCSKETLEPIPQPPLARLAGEGAGVRVARIAAGFLNRFRGSLALTPTLSQREREFWDNLLLTLEPFLAGMVGHLLVILFPFS